MSLSWRDDQAQDLLLSQMCKRETHLTETMHCILISSQCNFPIAMIKKKHVQGDLWMKTFNWDLQFQRDSSPSPSGQRALQQASRHSPDRATERSQPTPQTGIRVRWEWQETLETSSSLPSDIPPLTRSSSPYPKNSINWGLSIQTYEPMRVTLIETAIPRMVINGRVQSHDDGQEAASCLHN